VDYSTSQKRQKYTQVLILYFSNFKEKDYEYSFLDPPHFFLTKDSKRSHKQPTRAARKIHF